MHPANDYAERKICIDTDIAGAVVSARAGDVALILRGPEHTASGGSDRVIMSVPCQTSLQAIITLANTTQRPVLITDNGRLVGACGPQEIIAALDRSRSGKAGQTAEAG
jgi:hypothetical protein